MAAFSVPYLRGVASKVADAFGLSVADASRIVGYYSLKGDGVGVSGCENLDKTIIRAAADSVGVALPGSDADGSKADSVKIEKDHGGAASKMTEKHEKPQKENNSLNNDIKARKTPKMTVKHGKNADVIQNTDIKDNNGMIDNARGADAVEVIQNRNGGAASLVSSSGFVLDMQTIDSIIADFARDLGYDEPGKMAGSQWRSACLLIGSYITKYRLLEDMTRNNAGRGGKCFDIDKISLCIDLFEFSCGKVRKAPLITDFCAFSGVSSSYLYNVNGRCLVTSRGIDIRKKLQDMQQAGIASGIVNDRENPTGKIYFSKAILGWSENNNAAPIQEEKSQSVAALPVFGAPDDN